MARGREGLGRMDGGDKLIPLNLPYAIPKHVSWPQVWRVPVSYLKLKKLIPYRSEIK